MEAKVIVTYVVCDDTIKNLKVITSSLSEELNGCEQSQRLPGLTHQLYNPIIFKIHLLHQSPYYQAVLDA